MKSDFKTTSHIVNEISFKVLNKAAGKAIKKGDVKKAEKFASAAQKKAIPGLGKAMGLIREP